jgi:hypothetical protein
MRDTEESGKKTHFLSLYPKIFDYSLRGYYDQEHWVRTRRYYQKSYYLMIKEATIYLSLYSKHVFDYSLGGYSHRERWPRTRRNFYMHKKSKEGERRLGKRNYYHREGIYINQGRTTQRFSEPKQSNKAAIYDSRVTSSRQYSNAMIETYHEGKTSGSGQLVYAHGCTLLVTIRVYDVKKILVDALGTLRTTGTRSL